MRDRRRVLSLYGDGISTDCLWRFGRRHTWGWQQICKGTIVLLTQPTHHDRSVLIMTAYRPHIIIIYVFFSSSSFFVMLSISCFSERSYDWELVGESEVMSHLSAQSTWMVPTAADIWLPGQDLLENDNETDVLVFVVVLFPCWLAFHAVPEIRIVVIFDWLFVLCISRWCWHHDDFAGMSSCACFRRESDAENETGSFVLKLRRHSLWRLFEGRVRRNVEWQLIVSGACCSSCRLWRQSRAWKISSRETEVETGGRVRAR